MAKHLLVWFRKPFSGSELGYATNREKRAMDAATRLGQWYANQCNGDWEHGFGVRIETLDNPGWSVTINLVQTPLESASFQSQSVGMDDDNHDDDGNQGWPWWDCAVSDQQFQAVCDPLSLDTVLNIFLRWSEQNGSSTSR